MGVESIEKKGNTINIRVSSSQLDTIEAAKVRNPRISTTDVMMSGANLLRVLSGLSADTAGVYNELVNALIIHDDLLRCLAKPKNPQIDDDRNKSELKKSLMENEKKIITFLKCIIENNGIS
ncbi:hypothetical protein [Butyrivibrio sp. INlla14]|uniref:hypothetical protein n=1 Tax=Butyrivibrio sp. INlla14 TaxID=1520808 RepID=UPI0008774207|nr:hypothetical protein [Butyrivibrio sp. INlla14]SCX85021.1 hypothetical protein SAMN02910371_00195 [Butyrivibrio sp. INlla14]